MMSKDNERFEIINVCKVGSRYDIYAIELQEAYNNRRLAQQMLDNATEEFYIDKANDLLKIANDSINQLFKEIKQEYARNGVTEVQRPTTLLQKLLEMIRRHDEVQKINKAKHEHEGTTYTAPDGSIIDLLEGMGWGVKE